MKRVKRSVMCIRFGLWIAIAALCPSAARAEVKLPHVIGSHMVLQRDIEVPVWGWADPGEQVSVKLMSQEVSTTADEHGQWSVRLEPMSAGGPHEMTVSGTNTIKLEGVLIGEVWICSGQSNMEMGITRVDNADDEVAAADYPKIRLFHLDWKTAPAPLGDVDATWVACNPENIKVGGWLGSGFSAVAYFFGREIHREIDVPVGLIDTSWGGTRIEPWTPREGFATVPSLKDMLKVIDDATPNYKSAVGKAVEDYEKWIPSARGALDTGKPVPTPPPWPGHQLEDHTQPTSIFNGMVNPLVPFAIRGAIWYQGESNHADGMLYHEKMKALINGWRQVWGQGDFPFYFVQLAPFDALYEDEQLPRIWEAQTASLAIPNTGMAVTVDITDLKDIHPANKQDVGKRLARWALAKTYGRDDLVYSGPLYKSMAIEGKEIRLSFDHVGSGLASRNGEPLTWFQIAGEDRKFVDAEARIDGDTVIVASEKVAEPVAVRFAWSRKAQPNLMNKEGLPASPFRTDRW